MRRLRRTSRRQLGVEKLERRVLLAYSVNTGLVSHWTMNEVFGSTLPDLVDGDQPGVLRFDASITSGKIRQGVQLDGVGDSIEIASSSVFNILTAPFSVSIWVRTLDTQATIIGRGPANSDHWALRIVNGTPQFQFQPGGGIQSVQSQVAVSDGSWHHWVAVRNGTHSAKLFIDGVQVASLINNGPFTSIDNTQPITIGSGSFGDLQGTVDDARFYRRALTESDVAALYQLGQSPVAVDDVYAGIADSTVFVNSDNGLLVNDLAADEVIPRISIESLPLHGLLAVNPDGSFRYKPEPGFIGKDAFRYRIEDARSSSSEAVVSIQVVGSTFWDSLVARLQSTASSLSTDFAATSVAGWLSNMASDGSFSDLSYTPGTNELGFSLMAHTWRLRNMAKAYYESTSEYFGSTLLREEIAKGWNFLAVSAPSSSSVTNWYSQKIGIPNSIWPGLALFHAELNPVTTQAVLDKYFTTAGVWERNDLTERSGGMNLSYRALAAIAESVLRNDASLIPELVSALESDLAFQGSQATGLRPDNSFHQHTSYFVGHTYSGGVQPNEAVQWYSGSYGVGYAKHLAIITNWLHGTTLAMNGDAEKSVVDYVLDGQRWLFRNKSIEPTSTGRSITLNAETNETEEVIDEVGDTLTATMNLLTVGYRSDELMSFAASLMPESATTSQVTGNKSFWTSDVMIQQQADFMASVRMISQRTLRPETLQRPDQPRSEGAKSYFLADGVTTVFRDGLELNASSGGEIFPTWNWTRLPGTTLEQISDAELVSLSYSTARDFRASSATGIFVGSVSNGRTGLASMDYGRTAGKVTAKKSWFFFEDGFIALGAGINAPQAVNDVNTTLSQVRATGDLLIKDAQGVRSLTSDSTNRLDSAQWVLQDQVGYVPLGSQDPLVIQKQSRVGDWADIGISQGAVSAEVFSAWFDHGLRPNNKSYAYAVIPNTTSTKLDDFVNSGVVAVLSNTPQVQAVRDSRTATTQAAFFQPGSLTIQPGLTLTVSHPCLVQLRELPNNDLELSISDPTQSLTQVSVAISRRLYDSDLIWDSDNQISRWIVPLPDGVNQVLRGQSVTRTLQGRPTVTLSLSQVSLLERGGSAWIYAQLSAPTTKNVTVEFVFQGTATIGVDYTKSSVAQLVIPAGQTIGSTWIAARDDSVHESTETIQIEILKVINAFESPRQTLQASIIDDDPAPASVTLAWSNTSVSEAGGASYLTATLAQPSSLPVTIEFAFDGTATLNADYARSALTRIVIPAGQLSTSLWMLARNDEILEGPETVSAVVSRITNGIIIGPSAYELIIVDDEVTVTLSLSQVSLLERGGSAWIYAQLSAPTTKNVTVEFVFQGTATIGVDYIKSSVAQLVIPAGQTVGSTWIATRDDTVYESTETIQIEIRQVINAIESPRQTLQASIIDDDPAPASVTLAWSNTSVSEAGGASYLTATLAQPSSLPVTIEFAFAGTATLNADYARSALTRIVIPAGQLSASLWMLARNDEILEGPETVSAVVSRITNGVIVGPSQYELIIVDDDEILMLSRSQSIFPDTGANGLSLRQSSTATAHDFTPEPKNQRQIKLGVYRSASEFVWTPHTATITHVFPNPRVGTRILISLPAPYVPVSIRQER